ncbi:hypothetical protein [Spirosoma pomorum]|jgi:hypothetical protein
MAKQSTEPESMESIYKKMVDDMKNEISEMRKQYSDLLIRYGEMSKHILDVKEMTLRSMGVNPETNESDERAFDEALENINNNSAVVNGIMSHIYRGRVVSLKQKADRTVSFYFGNHNSRVKNKNYKATTAGLTEESFVLILEAMEFAAKKFGTDRKQMAKSLTGTEEPISFKQVISHL